MYESSYTCRWLWNENIISKTKADDRGWRKADDMAYYEIIFLLWNK